MNANTGEIRDFTPEEFDKLSEDWIPVKQEEMTQKQKEEKMVSLKDHKSKLGVKLTRRRSEPCFCGSGIKFKFCCRNKPKTMYK